MNHYEVVGVKGSKCGCDYNGAEWQRDAKELLGKMAESGRYEQVFIRQYYHDRFGRESFRVLHRHTWRAAAEGKDL